MSVLVDEDAIVGNILACAKLRGIDILSVDTVVKVANLADEKSDKYNISLSHRSVHDFLYNYPFFATLKGDSLVEINQDTSENTWTRYFRVGAFTTVLLALEQAFSEVVT